MTNPHVSREDAVHTAVKVKVGIIIACLLATLGLALYHPFFHIDRGSIFVAGVQRIDENEIKDAVEGIISSSIWGIIPRRSYFTADVIEIRDILKLRFPIETVAIKKEFPNSIRIAVAEKITTVIYDDGRTYGYVGFDGRVVEILEMVGDDEWIVLPDAASDGQPPSTTEFAEPERIHIPAVKRVQRQFGNYPIVYDMRKKAAAEDRDAVESVLEPTEVEWIVSWFNLLSQKSDIPADYFLLSEDGRVDIKTEEGWDIRAVMSRSAERQFGDLLLVFKEQDISRPYLRYVDVRYDGRVFWK